MKNGRPTAQEPKSALGSAKPYPVRVGCIDIGSNGIRLAAWQSAAGTDREVLVEERAPVRLGTGAFRDGRLDPGAMDAAIGALRRFREILDRMEVDHVRVVATSAVRESHNKRDFISLVEREADLRVDVIHGMEEARLIHLAVRERIPMDKAPWIVVDLGGGSVEVALADARQVLWSDSRALGAVRLLVELETVRGARPTPTGAAMVRLLDEYVDQIQPPDPLGSTPLDGFAATGGNAEALSKLTGAPRDKAGVAVMDTERLAETLAELERLDLDERIQRFGMRPDRADVILPAGHVYVRLAQRMGVPRIHVPGVGLKEGVLLDLLQTHSTRPATPAEHEARVRDGAWTLGMRYGFDEAHALHVAMLADGLYRDTQELHELSENDRRILLAAAVLHDIGQSIAYRRHHKHSLYVIRHAQLAGIPDSDRELVAQVARYHRKALPTKRHAPFEMLAPKDRRRVQHLAAILRVADALDRQHRQLVINVHAEVRPGAVHLHVIAAGDITPEAAALEHKGDLMRNLYRRPLVVHTSGERP
jgi:exopolyphosphatase / guanosine-5'-triphosphate,3'-diphosphate pyrophosphatase